MKRAVACAFLLLSSLTLAAQNTGTASDGASSQARNSALRASDAFEVSHGGGTCPIGMRASQGLWDHTVAVRKGLGDQKFGQRISLTLKDAHPSRIETATVRVHGLTGKSYMLQTSTDTNETRDAARMLNVTLRRTSRWHRLRGSVDFGLHLGELSRVAGSLRMRMALPGESQKMQFAASRLIQSCSSRAGRSYGAGVGAGRGCEAVLPSVMPSAHRIASKYILRMSGSCQASSVWPSVE